MNDDALLTLDPANPTPPYEQIAAQVRAQITAGRLAPGEELPSIRQLARDLRIAPNTVARAYDELARDGWVLAEARRGVRVASGALAPPATERRRRLSAAVAEMLLAASRLGVSGVEVRAEMERQLAAHDFIAPDIGTATTLE